VHLGGRVIIVWLSNKENVFFSVNFPRFSLEKRDRGMHCTHNKKSSWDVVAVMCDDAIE